MNGTSSAPTGRARRRLLVAAVVGTTLEWYDFMFYGTLAALVLNQLFFPTLDPAVGQLAAFASFGVAFLARPIGAVFFGYLADRFGRKLSLTWTLLLMGAATLLMGLLPTYNDIGVLATILLVFLRIIQGLAVGGEWGGAATLLLEHAPEEERGRYTGWVQAGGLIGPTLGSLVVLVLNLTLTSEQFIAWGWRLPFFASIILVVLGVYIRRSLPESQVFTQLATSQERSKFPLFDAIRHNGRELVLVFFMYVAQVSMTYMSLTFALAYAKNRGATPTEALTAATVAGLAGCLLILVGRVSDRVGVRKFYVIGCLGLSAVGFPFFALVDARNPVLLAVGLSLGFCSAAMLYMLQGALFTEMFAAGHRTTGASVGVQLGGIVGGGLGPVIATLLVGLGGGTSTFVSLYIVLVGLLGAAAALMVKPRPKSQSAAKSEHGLSQVVE